MIAVYDFWSVLVLLPLMYSVFLDLIHFTRITHKYDNNFRIFTLLCTSLGGRIVMFLTTGFLIGEIVGVQLNFNHIFSSPLGI